MEVMKLHRLTLLILLAVTLTFTAFQCVPVTLNVLGPTIFKGNLLPSDRQGVALKLLPYKVAKNLAGVGVPESELGEGEPLLPPLELKGKDKRVAFKAKKDGGFGFALFDRACSGEFDARVTISIGSDAGLVSASSPANILSGSRAAIELDRPAVPFGEIPQAFTFIAVGWNAEISGMNVATRQKAGFGQPQLTLGTAMFEDTLSVDVRIEQTATDLVTSARATPPVAAEGDAGWQVVSTQAIAVPDDEFRLGFGVVGMQKKGTFFFDEFLLTGDGVGGDVERGLLDDLLEAALPLLQVRELLAGDPEAEGDLFSPLLDGARADLDALIADIESAADGDTLQANTEWKSARKALAGTGKLLKSASKAAGSFKPKSLNIVSKKTEKALEKLEIAAANLMGLRAKSSKQLPAATFVDE